MGVICLFKLWLNWTLVSFNPCCKSFFFFIILLSTGIFLLLLTQSIFCRHKFRTNPMNLGATGLLMSCQNEVLCLKNLGLLVSFNPYCKLFLLFLMLCQCKRPDRIDFNFQVFKKEHILFPHFR